MKLVGYERDEQYEVYKSFDIKLDSHNYVLSVDENK